MDNSSANYWVTRLFDHYCIMQIEFPIITLPDITILGFWSDSIYDSNTLIAKLISVSLYLDLMPHRSVEDVFNDRDGRFNDILPGLLQSRVK